MYSNTLWYGLSIPVAISRLNWWLVAGVILCMHIGAKIFFPWNNRSILNTILLYLLLNLELHHDPTLLVLVSSVEILFCGFWIRKKVIKMIVKIYNYNIDLLKNILCEQNYRIVVRFFNFNDTHSASKHICLTLMFTREISD